MTTSIDSSLSPETTAALIARLTASYGRPVQGTNVGATPTRTDTPAARRAEGSVSKLAQIKLQQAEKNDGSQAAPVVRQLITTAPLPCFGTLDAKGYIVAMRRARTRDDRIAAIAGYVGFDTCGEYASQELSANMKAQQELRGAVRPLPVPVHSARVTVAGFVAGMPNEHAKRLADLQGRETLAAETLADFAQKAREALEAGDEANAVNFAGLAQVEAERLAQIKIDLAAM